jgi:glutamine cyclotransferase
MFVRSCTPFFSSILANVWYQDVLIRIDPITAKVTRVYDLSDIYPYEQRHRDGADCLNGISVTGGSGDGKEGIELYVTGKLWPNMYRIRLID